MVQNVTVPKALEYKEKLEKVDGVSSVTWLDDAVDITEPIEMQDKDIDKILKPIQGGNMEVYSFTSSKNTNVSLVQFVIKTSEIKKEEVKEDKKTKEEQTFFQKFISLFTDLFN